MVRVEQCRDKVSRAVLYRYGKPAGDWLAAHTYLDE
jgi:hypothetical protein